MCHRPTLERSFMGLRQDPNLVRRARSIRTARNKISYGFDDAASLFHLLRQDVAKNATLFLVVVILACTQFVQNTPRHKSRRCQVRRWVCKILPRHRPMILEDGDIFEPLVQLQILNPLRRQTKKLFYLSIRGVPQLMVVSWIFNQYLVRANRTHAVVDAVSLTLWIPLNAIERRWMNN